MKIINSDPGNPLFAFYKNYTRFALVTHAFWPKGKEFWICLDSDNGVLGYFHFKTPDLETEFTGYPKYFELIGVYPAHASIPDSADVYKLFLCPQREGI